MKSQDRDSLLVGYATGKMTEAELEAFAEHVRNDPEFVEMLINLTPVRLALQDPELRRELLADDEQTPAALHVRWWLLSWKPGWAIGLASALILLGVLIYWGLRHSAPEPVIVHEQQQKQKQPEGPIPKQERAPEREFSDQAVMTVVPNVQNLGSSGNCQFRLPLQGRIRFELRMGADIPKRLFRVELKGAGNTNEPFDITDWNHIRPTPRGLISVDAHSQLVLPFVRAQNLVRLSFKVIDERDSETIETFGCLAAP